MLSELIIMNSASQCNLYSVLEYVLYNTLFPIYMKASIIYEKSQFMFPQQSIVILTNFFLSF